MNFPNFLTLLRIALAPVFLALLLQSPAEYPNILAFVFPIFAAAALTDAFDGFLARKWKQETELGIFLDPVADKVLILFGFLGILLTAQPVFKLPVWFQILVLFRELVIIIGVMTLFFFTGKIHSLPNKLGKLTTVTQILLIGSCILNWAGTANFSYAVAFLTAASCVVYTVQGMAKF